MNNGKDGLTGEINNAGAHNRGLEEQRIWQEPEERKKTSQRKSKQNMFSLPTTFQSQVWRHLIVIFKAFLLNKWVALASNSDRERETEPCQCNLIKIDI